MCRTDGTIPTVPVGAGAEEAGPLLTIPLEPVDAVTVTTLADNVNDLLAADAGSACSQSTSSARYRRYSRTACCMRG